MKKTFLSLRSMRSSLLSAALFAAPLAGFAQSNWLPIFGDLNPNAYMACKSAQSIPCTVTPSAIGATTFKEISLLQDFTSPGVAAPGQNRFASSVLDNTGKVLFSVNADGMYAPDGTLVHGFYQTLTYSLSGSCVTYYDVYEAVSEVVTFPTPCAPGRQPNSYWAVFFSRRGTALDRSKVLRAIKVTLTPSFGTSAPVSSWYSFDEQLLDPPTCSGGTIVDHFFYTFGAPGVGGPANNAFEIVADAATSGFDRSIYTVNVDMVGSGTSATFPTTIRKWTFTGANAPTTSTQIIQTTALLHPAYSKTKLFKKNGSGHLLLSYVGMNPSGSLSTALQTYDLNVPSTSPEIVTYTTPSGSGAYGKIWGFEYLEETGKNVFCFSYTTHNSSDALVDGSLGFAAPGSAGATVAMSNCYSPISARDYCKTDLERTKNGDMLLVKYNPFTTPPVSGVPPSPGNLAYIKASDLNSSFMTTAAPTEFTIDFSGVYGWTVCPYYYNKISINDRNLAADCFYLGSQIRRENYNAWIPDFWQGYTVTGTETWTPSSNPMTALTGVPVSSISFANINIPAGASLTITGGLTVKMAAKGSIDVRQSTSSSAGGRLVVDNATLTAFVDPCAGQSGRFWNGIHVYGIPTAVQGALTTSKQGWVIVRNNSTIAYALTAIAAEETAGFSGLAGGGVIQVSNSLFLNDHYGLFFRPYTNHSATTGAVISDLSYVTNSKFHFIDHDCYFGDLAGVWCKSVKNIRITGCEFLNSTGEYSKAYGVLAYTAGVNIASSTNIMGVITSQSSFTKFQFGVYHIGALKDYTANIGTTIFKDNAYGVDLVSSYAPSVRYCTFKLPHNTSAWFQHPFATGTIIQSLGILLEKTMYYSVYGNDFSQSVIALDNKTVGVLALNTQNTFEENQVNNNTFTKMGVACLSNGKNRAGNQQGLWFKCNTYVDGEHDIAAIGTNADMTSGHGIRNPQGIQIAGSYAFPFTAGTPSVWYPNGVPAGNQFSTIPAVHLFYQLGGVYPSEYKYYSGAPGVEIPTNNVNSSGIDPVPGPNQCGLPGGLSDGTTTPYLVAFGENSNPVDDHLVLLNNVNYGMNIDETDDARAISYEWARAQRSSLGDLAVAEMMVQDSLIDSAKYVYNDIVPKYQLNQLEADEMIRGYKLLSIMIDNKTQSRDLLSLDVNQELTVRNIAAGSGWPAFKAKAWLMSELLDTLVTDSLYYPAGGLVQGNPGGGIVNGSPTVTIIPNPCDYVNTISVHASDNFMIDHIVLVNTTMPNITYGQNYSGNNDTEDFDVSSVMPGVYTVLVYNSNGDIITTYLQR